MNSRDYVLEQLEQHRNEYLSGTALAKNLGVSRNAVWKSITELRGLGYEIESTRSGYRLSDNTDILSYQSVSPFLKYPLKLSVYDEISSTNNFLKELADKGEPEGRVVVSRMQTAGKGRLGRSFYSPLDTGLYISILLRPDMPAEDSLFLTTSAAVSVVSAIEEISEKKAGIKWVNDVYIDDKKACGILTEASFNIETGKLDYAVVGIGINLCPPDDGFPKDVRDIAATVFDSRTDALGKRSKFLALILNRFMDFYYADLKDQYIEEYISKSILPGNDIYVLENGLKIPAKALSIDKKCRLLVQFEDGSRRKLNSGEVSTRLK